MLSKLISCIQRVKPMIKVLLFNGLVVFVLLCLVEGIAKCIMDKEGLGKTFFYNERVFENEKKFFTKFSFDLIDPLLGWGRSVKDTSGHYYLIKDGLVYVKSSREIDYNTKRIVVTGGSTSDVILDSLNWPVYLQKLFDENGYNAQVVVASIGGYNSGQEFLRLIRDCIHLAPFVHISYSGANEPKNPSYVSDYEYSVFEATVTNSTGKWLPNTTLLFKSALNKRSAVRLAENLSEDTPLFYKNNMHLMNAVSKEYNGAFLGILQPVINSGLYKANPKVAIKSMYFSDMYAVAYPTFQAFADTTPFMFNLSNVFDTCTGKVFVDDCHLTPEYQPLIACVILDKLIQLGILEE
jgi:hypothetical protein